MNPHFGWVPNPVAPGRIAGGSSGGSAAALAAGLADAALGTDSGGSIRIPAAFCGIVGFKPTFGLVPLDGCWPLAPSYDHAGPMARTVGECVAMMRALVPGLRGRTGAARSATSASRWRGPRTPTTACARRVEEAAARFPALEQIEFPHGEGNLRVFMREIAEVHARAVRRAARGLRRGPRSARSGPASRSPTPRSPRPSACARRSATRRPRLLDGFDLLLTPTQGFVAPTYEAAADDSLRSSITRFTQPVQRARLAGARASVRAGRARPPRVDPARRPARGGCVRARRRAGAGGSSPSVELPKERESHALLPSPRNRPPRTVPRLRSRRRDARRLDRDARPRRSSCTASCSGPTTRRRTRSRGRRRSRGSPSPARSATSSSSRPRGHSRRARCSRRKTTRHAQPSRSRSPCRGSPARRTRSTRACARSAPDGRTSPWSTRFGFNVRWTTLPTPLEAPAGSCAGRRSTAPTAYQVWFQEPNTIFKTQTNVADEREYYSFHQDPSWTGVVHWRIRAVRALYGVDATSHARNGLPETSFGPWSPVYTSTNTPFAGGSLDPRRDDLRRDLDRDGAHRAPPHARRSRSAATRSRAERRPSCTASTWQPTRTA